MQIRSDLDFVTSEDLESLQTIRIFLGIDYADRDQTWTQIFFAELLKSVNASSRL